MNNLHLPYDYLMEVRGSLIPSNALNPSRLLADQRSRVSLNLDGDAPFGMRAIWYADDQSPAATPLRWNLIRPSGLAYASSLIGRQPDSPVTFNPEVLYGVTDSIQMDVAAGAIGGGFTYVFRGVKYLAAQAERRPDAEEMEFSYLDEFTMDNGGAAGQPFAVRRGSVVLDVDADFVLQTLSFDVDGGYGELRMQLWDPSYRALSNAPIPIEVIAGDWGTSNGPRTFAPDVIFPAGGTITYQMTSWSPAELNLTIDVRLSFGGVKRYRR